MIKRVRLAQLLPLIPLMASAQIDPIKRDLIQLGYNTALQGHAPLAGYAFYYHNAPGFLRTNLTLRVALAPVYLDAELGIRSVLGEHTDLGIGLAGGGFADSYSEIRGGKFLQNESFTGHTAETALSVYHLFNPRQEIPLNLVVRGIVHYSLYQRDNDTDPAFQIPDDRTTFSVRTGLRWGGVEPTPFPSLAMELSAWYEGMFRMPSGPYGFAGDRSVQDNSHLFWAQALLAYTLPESKHSFYLSIKAGTSMEADRFSAYRLGALLPLVAEFSLSLPGYYYQEISARRFVLAGGNYLLPLDAKARWNLGVTAATAVVDYLPGLEQPGNWHSGVGAGILYRSRNDTTKIMISYGYGVEAIRNGGRGAHSVGILVQFDLSQARERLLDPENPNRWRGWRLIFGT
jgi:hypothetical protein